jgi:hypothetical protein
VSGLFCLLGGRTPETPGALFSAATEGVNPGRARINSSRQTLVTIVASRQWTPQTGFCVAVMAARNVDGVPPLVEAREIIAAFQAMVRNKVDAELAAWLARARSSLVASFAGGVAKDEAAVRAAITLPWSNGQTEGQITKLKLVKRQMYGRGKIDLLQARLIGAT